MSIKINMRRAALVLITLIIIFGIRGSKAQEKISAAKIHGYIDIFQTIEQYSLYELSKEEMEKMHECILSKAFRGITIERGATIKNQIKIPSCFPKDKYALYLSPEETKEMQIHQEGVFLGIGAVLQQLEDKSGTVIQEIYSGSPAHKDGRLKVGDIIIAVGTDENALKSIEGLEIGEVINKIRGPVGTKVYLKIKRGDEMRVFGIERGEVKLTSVESQELGPVGYIKIKSFEVENLAVKEIKPILDGFKTKGIKSLMLDLRNNPGGNLQDALKTLNLFSPRPHTPMVELRSRNGAFDGGSNVYKTTKQGEYYDWKVAVLVNGDSASAAEIVAGVMQIWGHRVVGVKTYGKGSVQTLVDIGGGGKFKLTTAKYYFSNGETPDGGGVTPDIAAENETEQIRKAAEYLLEELRKL